MANAKCRRCRRAADAGPYCCTCAADIMAKALNPVYGGRRKKLPRLPGNLHHGSRPRPPHSSRSSVGTQFRFVMDTGHQAVHS